MMKIKVKKDEAAIILKAMFNNRSPGSDGFKAEFFSKSFGGENGPFYSSFHQMWVY